MLARIYVEFATIKGYYTALKAVPECKTTQLKQLDNNACHPGKLPKVGEEQ
jgi:hypothetical protein